jgi:hypothetical protein
LPPYSALAKELNFCNKDMNECGSLSQGENGLFYRRAKTVYRKGENGRLPD